jgi:hypothetical protein
MALQPNNANITPTKQDMARFTDFISNEYTTVYARLNYLVSSRKYGCLYGEMMSGKSEAMVAIHHFYNMSGMGSIMALQQSEDLPQFEVSIDIYMKKYKDYYTENDWKMYPLQYEFASTLKLDEFNRVIDPKNIASIFTKGGSRATIIGIAHQDQFYRLTKLIYRTWGDDPALFRKFGSIYDEAHRTMFPEETEIILDGIPLPEYVDDAKWPVKLSKFESINAVIQFAQQVISVSATPQQNWFSDIHPPEFIIDIGLRGGYRDVLTIDYHIIPDLGESTVHEDPALRKVIAEWSVTPPMEKEKYGMKFDAPIAALINVSPFKKDHCKIRDYIVHNHPDEFVVITQNDSGTTMYMPPRLVSHIREKYKGYVTTVHGIKSPRTDRHKVSAINFVSYKDVPLSATYQFLADQGRLVERVVLISGNMVRQGRRISSFDYKIRLSHVFLRDTTSTCDNLIQKWRQVGYVFDNRPSLKGYCTADVHINTIKTINTVRDSVTLLNRKLNNIHNTEHNSSNQVLRTLTFAQKKLGTMPLCKSKVPMNIVDSDSDDFKLSVGDYEEEIRVTLYTYLKVKMPKGECKTRGCKNKTRNKTGNKTGKCGGCRKKAKKENKPKNQFELISKHLAGSRNTKIAVFLASMNPKGMYTRNEIIKLLANANYEQPNAIFTSITNPGSTWGPGCIITRNKGKWKISSNLRSAWQ